MKEMTRLKDHVDHQLDLRAPFAFMFNQITQGPTAEPPAEDPGAPFFVQEEAEYEELTEGGPTWGQLHCIREEKGEPAPPQPGLASQPQGEPGGTGAPAGQARKEGDGSTHEPDIHAEPV